MLIARTDADSASLLTSDVDDADRAFCTGERTPEGFFKIREGIEVTASRRLTHDVCPAPAACSRSLFVKHVYLMGLTSSPWRFRPPLP